MMNSTSIPNQQQDQVYVTSVVEVPSSTSVDMTTHTSNKKKRRVGSCHPICLTISILMGAIVLSIIVVFFLQASKKNQKDDERFDAQSATNPPTSPICPYKQVRITHMCDLPDLDEDSFFLGTDTTMDLKVLVNGQTYWPMDVQMDCSSDNGSYRGACVIPDTLLLDGLCFPLKNAISLDFEGNDDGEDSDSNSLAFSSISSPQDLKVTLYEEDLGSDDFVDILIPKEDWYFPSRCEDNIELNFYVQDGRSQNSRTHIKMIVDTILPGEEKICGADLEMITTGLIQTQIELNDFQKVLQQYVSLVPPPARRRSRHQLRLLEEIESTHQPQHQHHRQLIFPALLAGGRVLLAGARSFGGAFAKGAKKNPLGTLGDLASIGSTWFSFTSSQNDNNNNNGNTIINNNNPHWEETEAYFKQMLERFDAIDDELDILQNQFQKGMETLGMMIQETLAYQELDDWIVGHLTSLRNDYRAYIHPEHTAESRQVYQSIFHQSCTIHHSPFTTFQVLYSHICDVNSCTDSSMVLSSTTSQQFLLNTFVDLAQTSFPKDVDNVNDDDDDAIVIDRILWFRQTFGSLMMSALTEAMFLHSVCLYQPPLLSSSSSAAAATARNNDDIVCQNEDPVWISRLEAMGVGIEDVAQRLVDAESELE